MVADLTAHELCPKLGAYVQLSLQLMCQELQHWEKEGGDKLVSWVMMYLMEMRLEEEIP